MKILIEEATKVNDIEVIIRCNEKNERIKRLVELLECEDRALLGYQENKAIKIPLREVLYIESVDQRVFAYRKHDVLEIKYKLYELENLVQHYYFMRCNKSTIINIRKIEALLPQLNRTLFAQMENGEGVIISRKYINELKEKIEN